MSRPILEWARRRAHLESTSSPIEALRDGQSVDEVEARTGFSRAAVLGVQTFYDLLHGGQGLRLCDGTACHFARHADHPVAMPRPDTVRCVGRCYEAPAVLADGDFPIPRFALTPEPALFRNLLGGANTDPASYYALPDGATILDAVEVSGLRGRGGSGYPTAAKWRSAAVQSDPEKFVVANGDEGDPGSFVDRLLLEDDPHAVLAGMSACAKAIRARRGIVYVRGEYPRAVEVVRNAIAEARSSGWLPRDFTVEVHRGAGSYVCGEETAMLRAIEGLRAEASPKPPYPAERGLFGRPTIVQNVETLALVPWILTTGGTPSTKAFSISGAVCRPGAYEAELGISLRELLGAAGGPPPGRSWKMAVVGGPMGRVLPADDFGVRLAYESTPGLGHGGVVVLDTTVSARAVAEHLFAFAASESCGACTPCRAGTRQLSAAARESRTALERLLATLEIGSMCAFGTSVPRPIHDLIRAFGHELFEETPGGSS